MVLHDHWACTIITQPKRVMFINLGQFLSYNLFFIRLSILCYYFSYWYWSSRLWCLKMCTSKNINYSASQRAPLNFNVNYITVVKYTCTYQISYKAEIFNSFYNMHFYLDLLLVNKAYYIELMTYFCFWAWSKPVCYVMTVELNCNFISTKIVLIVSSILKSWPEKKLLVLKQTMINIKIYFLFVLEIINVFLCKEHCANRSVT